MRHSSRRTGIGHGDKQQDNTHGRKQLARRPEHEATEPDQLDDRFRPHTVIYGLRLDQERHFSKLARAPLTLSRSAALPNNEDSTIRVSSGSKSTNCSDTSMCGGVAALSS